MVSALRYALLATALSLACSAVSAGEGHSRYGDRYGPPPETGMPAGIEEDYPPPEAYAHSGGHQDADAGYRAEASHAHVRQSREGESYSARTTRSSEDYGYDSGWREQGRDEGQAPHSDAYAEAGHEGYGGGESYSGGWGGRYGVRRGAHYASLSVSSYEYDSGWRESGQVESGPRHVQGERLSDTFFADSGGVGPAWINGGGGGGGFFILGSGGGGGSSFASAHASASARVSIGVRAHGGYKGGGYHGGGGKHGCGCH